MGQAAVVTDDAPVVRVQDFVKRYRKLTAVEGVGLAIRRGEIYGLIGPDGAGKSSLMKAIAGVLAFEGGRVATWTWRGEAAASRGRVMLVHGWSGRALVMTAFVEPLLRQGIDVVAIDLPGHGDSDGRRPGSPAVRTGRADARR